MTPDMPWAVDAACAGVDPTLWFPDEHGGQYAARMARKVCADCPVRLECLDYALTTHQLFGVWGGLSEQQRRPLHRERRAA